MSYNLKIIKGLPFSYLFTVKNDDQIVNVNDGNWSYSVKLQFQVPGGNEPVAITPQVVGNTFIVSLTGTQTALYNHLGTGYIMVVDVRKTDASVILNNKIPVDVVDGL